MPFTAFIIDESKKAGPGGERICTLDYLSEEGGVDSLRYRVASARGEGRSVVCMGCGGPMVLVAPIFSSICRPHFRHKSKPNSCSFGKESNAHLQAKAQLLMLIRDQIRDLGVEGVTVDTEVPVYTEGGKLIRIADVMEEHPHGYKVAHEIQLSRIPIQQLIARSESYLSLGYGCAWHLGPELWKSDHFLAQLRDSGECCYFALSWVEVEDPAYITIPNG